VPRNADGSYSAPAGTLVNSGDTLLVSQHNPFVADIATAVGNSLDRDGSGGMRAALNMGGNAIQNVTPGTNPTDAATVSQLGSTSSVPVGSIMDYAGSSAPSGWLICGGQSVSRAAYAALFDVIGTTYGAADGTTFRLPDLRGRTTAGMDFSVSGLAGRLSSATMTPDGATLAAVGGTQTHVLTTAQLPAHVHTLSGTTSSDGAHTHNIKTLGDTGPTENRPISSSGPFGDSFDTGSSGAHTHTLSGDTSSVGSGTAHLNVQPTMLLNKIIRATA
jgi:microcystin-dependent protein